jgi:divalent metal cation (Fe/Co/Zn/Cd) transporter
MTDLFKNNTSLVWSWVAMIGIAAIVCAVSHGTRFQQLGIGLLASAIALLVVVVVFEAIWQSVAKLLDGPGGKEAPKSAPKHRQRGQ